MKLKNYKDWEKNLIGSHIVTDSDWVWWDGAIDAIYLSGIINSDERCELKELLEKINNKRG